MIHIRRTLPEDVPFIAKRLRQGDRLELARAGLTDPAAALEESVRQSAFAFTALHDGVPMCLFGLRPDGILSRRARVWLLGTPEINTTKKGFVKTCQMVVDGLLDIYPVLYNAVDAQYPQARRLLTFLGAEFIKKAPSPNGNPFILFEIRRKK
jgi:hypothetical protein